ncbi:ABC transporter ATP-binding protein [Salidesulfovibrio onnuriiensis]|uniref:ABC transporter ATP-binding protein n=1 Tax=Salidesulfovibrio onnuriiensis TaxID=2583823 RepID=UPI0011CA72AB|nr:ABC transporter ATP-binding protein [Salidesulfovibrio onnuriiensis]
MKSFILDILARNGWAKTLCMLVLFAVSSIAETSGLLLLLPTLSLLGIAVADGGSTIMRVYGQSMAFLGIPVNLTSTVCVVVVAFAVQYSLLLSAWWLGSKLQHDYRAYWRNELFRAIYGAKWSFFVNRKSGAIMNVFYAEIDRMGMVFASLQQIWCCMVGAVLILVAAVGVSLPVTLGLILAGCCIVLVVKPFQKRAFRLGCALSQANSNFQSSGYEFWSAAKFLKVSAAEGKAGGLFGKAVEGIRKVGVPYLVDPVIVRCIFEFTGIIVLLFTLVYGTREMGLGTGEAAILLALFVRLYPKMSQMLQSVQLLKSLFPGYANTLEVYRAALAEQEHTGEGSLEWDEALPAVEFRDVSVSYGNTPVLKNITLSIPQGAFVAIAGASGAGKSTLVDTVMGLVDAGSGEVLVNGKSLSGISLGSWRRVVGYVGQESLLFNASIMENMRWGDETATDEEIVQAARKAHAHEFVQSLEQGYETAVGDRGVKLSGGQKQRIGLGRALLGEKRLLILDEATSALDSESEREVMKNVEELHGELSILAIAHRLSTIRKADWVYYLEDGRIIEQGSFEDLLKMNGRFAAMWAMQS